MSEILLQEYFEKRYRPSDFSNDFLTNLTRVKEGLSKVGGSLEGMEERMANFILDWDENKGYDNSSHMLRAAQDAFITQELRRLGKEHWVAKFQYINPVSDDALKPLKNVYVERAEESDGGRMDANDREGNIVSNAARCRILSTPYRGASGDVPERKACGTVQAVPSSTIPYIMRRETLQTHPMKIYSRRTQRYF